MRLSRMVNGERAAPHWLLHGFLSVVEDNIMRWEFGQRVEYFKQEISLKQI